MNKANKGWYKLPTELIGQRCVAVSKQSSKHHEFIFYKGYEQGKKETASYFINFLNSLKVEGSKTIELHETTLKVIADLYGVSYEKDHIF